MSIRHHQGPRLGEELETTWRRAFGGLWPASPPLLHVCSKPGSAEGVGTQVEVARPSGRQQDRTFGKELLRKTFLSGIHHEFQELADFSRSRFRIVFCNNSFEPLDAAKRKQGKAATHRTSNLPCLGKGSATAAFALDSDLDKNLPTTLPPYPRGTLAMANAGPGTNGSQFFIVYKDSDIPPDYSVFGQVTSGLDLLDRIAAAGTTTGGADGPPKLAVQITEIRVS